MNKVFDDIYNVGVVPVVTLERLSDAVPLAKALIAGGIPCAEITFRTDVAKDAIKEISSAYPDMLVGAGTVRSLQQAKDAINAGAKFIVSPATIPEVINYCTKNGVPVIAGAVTPTEIENLLSFGVNTVKFFPSESFGGAKTLKSLNGPYKEVKFLPTGGINLNNLMSYLTLPNVLACGGSWMAEKGLICSGNFSEIKRTCRETMKIILGFDYEKEIKEKCAEKGCVTLKTNSIRRAKRFLSSKGFDFSIGDTVGTNAFGFTVTLTEKEQGV